MKICFYTTGDIKSIATMKRALGMADPLVNLGWEVFIIAMNTDENLKRIAMESSSAKPYYFNPTIKFKLKISFYHGLFLFLFLYIFKPFYLIEFEVIVLKYTLGIGIVAFLATFIVLYQ